MSDQPHKPDPLSPAIFHAQLQYLSRRFGVIDPALAEDYYEFLQYIPNDRFVQICKEVYRDWEGYKLPAPKYFLDRSNEIAKREPPKLRLPEPEIDTSDPKWIAARDKFFEDFKTIVHQIAKPMPVPTEAERQIPKALDLELLRVWLHDPQNRGIAISEVKDRDDLEFIYSESGDILDIRQKPVAIRSVVLGAISDEL